MRNQVEKNAPVIIVGTRKIRSWTYMVLPHYENWVWRHLINLTNNKGRMLLERSQHETPQQRLLPDEAMEPSLRFVGGVQ